MRIAKLYGDDGPLRGLEVFIIGSGPSLRMFPTEFLAKKTCILLNDVWRHFHWLGPVAFLNSRRFASREKMPQKFVVVKGRNRGLEPADGAYNEVPEDHPDWYVFSFRDERFDGIGQHDDRAIFRECEFYYSSRGGTVAEYAIQFACWAGAKAVYLVGVDCAMLGGDHYYSEAIEETRIAYAVDKRCMEKRNYSTYPAGLVKLQRAAWAKFNVPVLSLTPFMGLKREEEQYAARGEV